MKRVLLLTIIAIVLLGFAIWMRNECLFLAFMSFMFFALVYFMYEIGKLE